MGVSVHLAVMAERVSDAAWRGIYERASHVATQWTPRPLSTAWRRVGRVRVPQYTLDLENAEGLHLVGDAETLSIGESFVFPATLERATSRREAGATPISSNDDVLVTIARWHASEGAPRVAWCDLLGAKTQGLPYHTLLIALGLLVENSLPGAAIVYGDISSRDGEQAQRGVASILGEEIQLPVVVDVERVRQRLAGSMDAGALDRAIRALCPPAPHHEAIFGDLLGRLRSSPAARVRYELEHLARSCSDPSLLHAGTRMLFRELIEAIRSNVVSGEIREQFEQQGASEAREMLANRALTSGIRLTSMAWDAIETADLDELAFLFVALCVDARRWEIYHAIHAILENRALWCMS